MLKIFRPLLIAVTALALGATPAFAQTAIVKYTGSDGKAVYVTPSTPLPVTGGGGGGGGDASAANQATQITAANSTNTKLDTLHTDVDGLEALAGTTNTNLGAPGATACATDTGSCSLNALLQRMAQRQTSTITALGSPFQAGGSIGNTTFGATQSGTWNLTNISGTITLPTGAATSANQTTELGYLDGVEGLIGTTNTNLGAPGATVCGSDTGSCSVNAQIQRMMQTLTALNTKVDTLNTNIGAQADTAATSGNCSVIACAKAQRDVVVSSTPTDTYSQPNAGANYGLVPVVSSAVETGHVIKASAGTLYGFNVTTGATAGNILVFNSTTVPAAGAVTPVKCYTVAANSTLEMGFTPPIYLGTGISIAFSSAASCFTKTDSSTAFISGDAK